MVGVSGWRRREWLVSLAGDVEIGWSLWLEALRMVGFSGCRP
jgi:hypothetical protein